MVTDWYMLYVQRDRALFRTLLERREELPEAMRTRGLFTALEWTYKVKLGNDADAWLAWLAANGD